jgi:hypothetical protein
METKAKSRESGEFKPISSAEDNVESDRDDRKSRNETRVKTKVYTRMFGLSSREVLIEGNYFG